MKSRSLLSILAGGALAFAAVLVPASTANAADSCTQNWSIKSTEGHANGQWCNYNTKVTGTVTDDKADGRCPFVRGYTTGGGHVDGPWIGPKGASKSFSLTAGSGKSFNKLEMKYVYC